MGYKEEYSRRLKEKLNRMTTKEIVDKITNDWSCPSCFSEYCTGCPKMYDYITIGKLIYVGYLGSEKVDLAFNIGRLKHSIIVKKEGIRDCKNKIDNCESKLCDLLDKS